MSLTVLEALASPTDEQYHAKLAELPVVIVRTATTDEHGRPGVTTTYMLNGKGKASRFSPAGPRDADGRMPQTLEVMPVADTDWGADSAPAPAEFMLPATECQYLDEDNYLWTGDCATQQEIDDATSLLVALEADAEGVGDEAAEDLYYCQTVLNMCWEESSAPLPTADAPTVFGGPSGSAACIGDSDECHRRALAFTGAAVTYGMRAVRLWGAIFASNPVGLAIAGHVTLVVGAAAGLVAAGIYFHDCVYAT